MGNGAVEQSSASKSAWDPLKSDLCVRGWGPRRGGEDGSPEVAKGRTRRARSIPRENLFAMVSVWATVGRNLQPSAPKEGVVALF
jgi:hypothetical protein